MRGLDGMEYVPSTSSAIEGSLKRLRTNRIDLVYQHRVNPAVPIEAIGKTARNAATTRDFGQQKNRL